MNDGKNNKPILAKTGNLTGQKWFIEKIPGEPYYRLTTKWQGRDKSLDIMNYGKIINLYLLKQAILLDRNGK